MINALENNKTVTLKNKKEFNNWIKNHNFPASIWEVFDTLKNHYIKDKHIWYIEYIIWKLSNE